MEDYSRLARSTRAWENLEWVEREQGVHSTTYFNLAIKISNASLWSVCLPSGRHWLEGSCTSLEQGKAEIFAVLMIKLPGTLIHSKQSAPNLLPVKKHASNYFYY